MLFRIAPYLLCCSVCFGATTVEMKGTATVKGPDVSLGEIANIQAEDAAMAKTVGRVFIRVAPTPGDSCLVTRNDVYGQLVRNGMKAVFAGPPQVVVTTGSSKVAGSQIAAAARAYLLERLGRQSEEAQIEMRGTIQDVTAPMGSVALQPDLPRNASLLGAISIPVRVVVDGQVWQTIQAPVLVRMFRDVLVTTKSVARGEEWSGENLALTKCEVTSTTGEVLSDLSCVEGKIAARTLPAGTILKNEYVGKVEVIRAGDLVTVQLARGAVRITMDGQAMKGGAVGDTILVRNTSSRKSFSARVVGPRAVAVSF